MEVDKNNEINQPPPESSSRQPTTSRRRVPAVQQLKPTSHQHQQHTGWGNNNTGGVNSFFTQSNNAIALLLVYHLDGAPKARQGLRLIRHDGMWADRDVSSVTPVPVSHGAQRTSNHSQVIHNIFLTSLEVIGVSEVSDSNNGFSGLNCTAVMG
eukprot:GHVN01010293.1.p1 GENE.GHVN01010293.1~~GHVN01010293.1.p1  ORF type:complete len:154 (+),score=35.56 GHVN01010293.1:553-1014(+)